MGGEGGKLARDAGRVALRAGQAFVGFLHAPEALKQGAAGVATVFVQRHRFPSGYYATTVYRAKRAAARFVETAGR